MLRLLTTVITALIRAVTHIILGVVNAVAKIVMAAGVKSPVVGQLFGWITMSGLGMGVLNYFGSA